jgi:hypothetical protein
MVAEKLATMTEGGDHRANLPSAQSLEEAAKKLNVSRRSVASARKVRTKATPEMSADSISSAPVLIIAQAAIHAGPDAIARGLSWPCRGYPSTGQLFHNALTSLPSIPSPAESASRMHGGCSNLARCETP